MKPLLFAASLVAASLVPALSMAEDSTRVQRVVSPGGIEAWLVSEPAIPMVAVEIGFEGGARLDPGDAAGVSYLTAALIEEGAGPYDAEGFADRLDELSARMSFSTGRDGFSVSMRTLTDNIEDSFELLHVALTEPRFEQTAVDRVREQVLVGLRSKENDPQSIAGMRWYAEMLPGSPYAIPTDGTIDSVTVLTRDDIAAAFDRMAVKNRMSIGVVGDIDAETLAPLLDATFGDLPDGDPLPEQSFEVRTEGGLVVVEQDVPQSAAVFGHRGILRSDPDFIPAYVMNYVLGGGGLTSRLTDEVREKNGLAYGVYSYLNPLDRAGLYMGGVATANARVGKSLELITQEWRRMAEGGLSEEELDAAKKYLTGAYALRFDSNAKIANMLVGVQQADLGIDYFDRRNDMVNAVTLEDIQRVAQRLLHPDDLFIVVVGSPEGLDG